MVTSTMIISIRHAAVMTSLIVALVAGCGGETKAKTFKVTGKIHSGGNPITGLPPGEKPMVKFEAKANKEQSQAKVAEDGAFSADLAAGIIRLREVRASWLTKKKAPGWYPRALKLKRMLLG